MLKKKNVLFYISALDITIDDILILKPIYEGIRKEDKYKIVWIPIVEQWNDELQKKFEMLRSKMPWYVVQYFSPVVGIKFIKEEWNFKNKPILVVMNRQGKVEHPKYSTWSEYGEWRPFLSLLRLKKLLLIEWMG